MKVYLLPFFVFAILIVIMTLNGCSNMSNRDQTIVSGMAIGGTIGNPITGFLGALIGAIVAGNKEEPKKVEDK